MTWREFDLAIRGYFLRYNRQKWMMREIVWNIWAANSMTENFSLTRKEIMLLPWDEQTPPIVEPTKEEIEEISRRFDKVYEATLKASCGELNK